MKQTVRTTLFTVIILLILAVAGYFIMQKYSSVSGTNAVIKDSGGNVSDYSAVFLTNGQVYFGKISSITDKEVDIYDIYYLQVNQQDLQQSGGKTPTPSPSANPNISLVKLGNELHGPNDRMHINREQVLFTESLKNDSQVVKAINDYKNK